MRRAVAWVWLLGGLLLLGCGVALNLPLEGPDGTWAVVLSPVGRYELVPEGGTVSVLDSEGNRVGEPLILGEGEAVQICDWSEAGELLLLVLSVDEHGLPMGGRLVEWRPGNEPRELLSYDGIILSPRFGVAGTVLYLDVGDEHASLVALERDTGEATLLQSGVIAFYTVGGETVTVTEEGRFFLLGVREMPLRIRCEEDCQMMFLFFSQIVLAVDPGGRYVAIVLDEASGVVTPEAEGVPTLYLVDLVEERVHRVAAPALSPSFSPDGTELAFVGQALGRPIQEIFVYQVGSEEIARVPESEGAVWVRWHRAGLLAGVGEDPTRLVRLDEGTAVDALPARP